MQDLQQEVNYDRINLLYRSVTTIVLGLLVGFIALLFSVGILLPISSLVIWSLSFAGVLLGRIRLYRSFKRGINTGDINRSNIKKWEYYWLAMSIATAVVLVSLLFFPSIQHTLITMLFIAMVFMGMSAGAIVSSNSSLLVIIPFISILSFPVIFKAIAGGSEYYTLAFVYALFYPTLLKLALSGNQIVINSIRLQKKSEDDSLRDSLTGLWNRRSLELFIEKLLATSQRHNKTFSMLMLDIDFFKKFNDTYGHLKGDKVLINTANCLQQNARDEDLLIRFGGEEFMLILPETDLDQAHAIAERILTTVRSETALTISAGVAQFMPDMRFDDLIKNADDALYLAKENGRDRVEVSYSTEKLS